MKKALDSHQGLSILLAETEEYEYIEFMRLFRHA